MSQRIYNNYISQYGYAPEKPKYLIAFGQQSNVKINFKDAVHIIIANSNSAPKKPTLKLILSTNPDKFTHQRSQSFIVLKEQFEAQVNNPPPTRKPLNKWIPTPFTQMSLSSTDAYVNNIPNCEITNHWNDNCNCDGYEMICKICKIVCQGRKDYYEHITAHNDDINCRKSIFYIGNFHTEQYLAKMGADRAVQLAWRCKNCEQRCMVPPSKHKCSSPMRMNTNVYLGCYEIQPFLVDYVVKCWVRNQIEYRYKLYAHIPNKILALLKIFYNDY
eukprot:451637_1